jgi:hypothetical protein
MFQQHVELLLLPQISHETSSTFQQILNNLSFYVHSNHKCGMHMKMSSVVFLIWLCCLYGCHYGLLFLLSLCFHIVIHHPIICVMFVSLPYIFLCFH